MHHVKLCRWPPGIEFKAPSALLVKEVEVVLRGLRKGDIYFRKLGDETLARASQEQMSATLNTQLLNAGRADRGNRRAPRSVETCSKKLIRRRVKTTRFVPAKDL